MDRTIFKGIHYLILNDQDLEAIKPEPFEWGGKKYPVGSKFEKLGSKKRTSLEMKHPLVYKGKIAAFVLFDVDAPQKEVQGSLFEFDDPTLHYFIAPGYIPGGTLLMQSSPSGFWDIRP